MIFQQASNIGALKILFTQFYGNREKNNIKIYVVRQHTYIHRNEKLIVSLYEK